MNRYPSLLTRRPALIKREMCSSFTFPPNDRSAHYKEATDQCELDKYITEEAKRTKPHKIICRKSKTTLNTLKYSILNYFTCIIQF